MTRIHDVVILDPPEGDREPRAVWKRLTPAARHILRTLAGPTGLAVGERTAYVIEGAQTERTAAALAELQLAGLIEAVRILGEKAPGYTLTPEGGGVVLFGPEESAKGMAETKRVSDFLRRRGT